MAVAAASGGAAATPSVERPLLTWQAVWNKGPLVYAGLCATDLNGHGFRVSDPNPRFPEEPLWSPDGRWIVLTRGSDVYVTDAQGRHRRKLTVSNPEYSGFYAADWSPDGSELLIHQYGRAFYSRLLLVKRDGTHARTLVVGSSGGAGSGSWSPDGQRILYSMDGAVYVIDTDGTTRRKLVDSAFSGGWSPVWSPDGRRFAYVAVDGLRRPDGLGLARADGTDAHMLVRGNIRTPAWSPDGSQLVYMEQRPNSTQFDLRVAHTDGSGDRLLTEAVGWGGPGLGERSGPTWSPDGTAIVFARGDWPSSRVALIKPDGTDERTVATGGFGALNPVWRPSAPLPSNRRPCLIRGSVRSDLIRGTDRGDFIVAGSGDNTIAGGGSGDVLLGRGGRDRLYGGGGEDTLVGGSGRDRLYGGGGEDTLVGGSGRDRLYGGPGDDFFRTRDRARDSVFGGPGRDAAFSEGLDRLRSVEQKIR